MAGCRSLKLGILILRGGENPQCRIANGWLVFPSKNFLSLFDDVSARRDQIVGFSWIGREIVNLPFEGSAARSWIKIAAHGFHIAHSDCNLSGVTAAGPYHRLARFELGLRSENDGQEVFS